LIVTRVLPHLSRFAVMQHLGVLERAGIVLVRREGRERWNELDAVPIQRELERWLNSLQHATRLTAAGLRAPSAGIRTEREGGVMHPVRPGSLETFRPQLQAWIERGEVIPPPEV